mgnify:CR=1 FL=1
MTKAHGLPITTVWMILAGATVASWALTEELSLAHLGTTVVLLIAAFKVNLLIGNFMELRWVHQPWRTVISIWLAVVVTLILGGYWYTLLA